MRNDQVNLEYSSTVDIITSITAQGYTYTEAYSRKRMHFTARNIIWSNRKIRLK